VIGIKPATPITRVNPELSGQEKLGRVPELDGIRGLAILMVLQFHWAEGLTRMNSVESTLYSVLRCGWLGVDLFFVLSGYLITGVLADAKAKPHYFKNFYMRRVLRIFPAYYGFVFFAQFVLPPLLRLGHHQAIWQDTDFWWYWLHLTNIGLAIHAPGAQGFSHFWSLAVEEQFYLLWPLLIFCLSRRAAMRTTMGLIMLAPVLRTILALMGNSQPAAYVLMPCRADALAMGAWLALAQREGALNPAFVGKARVVMWVCAAAVVGIFIGSGWSMEIENRAMQTVGLTIADLWFACFLGQAVAGGAWDFLRGRVLRRFGKYSYVVYIWHVPLHAMLWKLYAGLHVASALPTQFLGLIPFLFFGSFACLGIGALSWRFYEGPFLKLKCRFED
jgi:peptidoglycan/LPS O-acetylase OafA/YrhL